MRNVLRKHVNLFVCDSQFGCFIEDAGASRAVSAGYHFFTDSNDARLHVLLVAWIVVLVLSCTNDARLTWTL